MGEYKVIIIGGGISGITCGIYLKRAGISPLIIENNMLGGQLNKIDMIDNYPGKVNVSGIDMVSSLYEQVNNYNIDIVNDEITSIDYDKKEVTFDGGIYKYSFLVFATGKRERLLGLEEEKDYLGKGISLCASCDGALYKDGTVMVVGGGNSAVSEALYLSNICKSVYLVYRKDNLRSDNILKDRLDSRNNIITIYNDEVVKYLSDENGFMGVKLKSGKKILLDCVFLAIGSIPNSELFIGDKRNGYIVVNSDMESSIPSVYACGDVIDKDIYQLVSACNDGLVVANSIIKKYRW